MTPYHRLVSDFARLVRDGKQLPLGGFPPLPRPALAADAPLALIFSPHPDDECIIGGLALRLMREAGVRVDNVAVTQGSRRDRQAGRWEELTAACNHLGFGLIRTAPGGLEGINVRTRSGDRERWSAAVEVIAGILRERSPRVIFFPHDADSNSTHAGTHHLVMDALALQATGFICLAIETEFWGAMGTPNLMVESSADDLGDMVTALSFHAGEVRRNPYHLLVAPWMLDNVRRGAELVGGQGGAAPDFTFATLYRVRRWTGGRLEYVFDGGWSLAASESSGQLLSLI
ncbi:MAG TPA: PIG-L family deacetylase [Vicinamibacterales bacterium]|nr:PIG-L family deacetylase [Vicinamibacterales bacterium]